MSTQADHGHELVPRLAPTPDALRPVQSRILAWARDIEIARRPDLSSRCARAQGNLEHEDPVVAQDTLRELSAVLDAARTAPAAFLAAVARKAEELVRAAEALYLHGSAHRARGAQSRVGATP
ncbi:hypothetical protein [Streptomyces achromogenes]|uniref:hypothetical protein n=1 Tax=Streptomyces achromogenes TaxID=67255 RepID=UPI00371A589F